MNDRELLEAAAKAAGIKVLAGFQAERDAAGHGDVGLWASCTTCWNPLTDDGQALRLAVTLDLLHSPRVAHEIAVERFTKNADKLTATRRAIVRAAAEVGKSQAA